MPTLDGSVKSKTIPIRTRQGETIDFVDVSQSVGGTIYGTTPGGTRYVYKRDMLLSFRNTPLSCTPPVDLPIIPGVTKQHSNDEGPQVHLNGNKSNDHVNEDELSSRRVVQNAEEEDVPMKGSEDEELFQME